MNKRIKKENETSCEYILPDYMGDIRKILSSRARCVPGGKFASDGSLEASGCVEYEILYADSENRLTAINTESDYAVKCAIDNEAYRDSVLSDRVTGFSMRVTGPRKISLRATVESDIVVTSSAIVSVGGDALDSDSGPQKSTKVINVENYLYGTPLEREYAEEAERLEGLGGEDLEIIATSGVVRIAEVRTMEDSVEVKGEIIIVAIVKTPTEPPFRITKTIPFVEVVGVEGAEPSMNAIATATVTSAAFGMNDEDDTKVIVANVIAEFSACAVNNEECEVVTDAYLLSAKTDNRYSDFEYASATEEKREEITLSESVSAESVGCAQIRSILHSSAEPCDVRCEADGKSVNINGKIVYSAVACEINEDDSVSYIPIKHTAEFSHNVNLNSQNSPLSSIKAALTPIVCDVTLDGDEIAFSALISCVISAVEYKKITKLDSCNITEQLEGVCGPTVTVYYPDKSDTLFSVAKKYHKSCAALASVNNLSEAVSANGEDMSLSGVKKLLIM